MKDIDKRWEKADYRICLRCIMIKGKDLETILDELEADDEIAEKEISEIVNVAQNYAPEYDEEKIYDELEKTKKAD